MRLNDLLAKLEQKYPLAWQASYDNAGLSFAEGNPEIKRVLVSLDASRSGLEYLKKRPADLWLTHHPLLFYPFKKISSSDPNHSILVELIQHGIAHYSLHTNFDAAPFGTSELLAETLGLTNITKLEPRAEIYSKVLVFVPPSHLEQVKNTLVEAGAGELGKYSQCSFETQGYGYFLPGEGSKPYIGQVGTRESTLEIRLEMLFPRAKASLIQAALLSSHPYEEPAFDILHLQNTARDIGFGCVGTLPQAMPASDFFVFLKSLPFGQGMHRHKLGPSTIHKVACVGGAGSDLYRSAIEKGCQVLLTSEVKHHQFLATENQLWLCDLGHQASEQAFVPHFQKEISVLDPAIHVSTYIPELTTIS